MRHNRGQWACNQLILLPGIFAVIAHVMLITSIDRKGPVLQVPITKKTGLMQDSVGAGLNKHGTFNVLAKT